jgi:hypothetical protein
MKKLIPLLMLLVSSCGSPQVHTPVGVALPPPTVRYCVTYTRPGSIHSHLACEYTITRCLETRNELSSVLNFDVMEECTRFNLSR